MPVFTVHQAKSNLSRLIAEASTGGEVIIARGSVPVARLVPVSAPRKRQFGALRGQFTVDARFHEPLDDNELAAWEGH